MNIVFDVERINSLLTNFYTLTGLVVSLYDSEFTPIASSTIPTDFCCLVKTKYAMKCANCDMCAFMEAKNKKEAYSYTCHAGLRESVFPIFQEDTIVAYVLVGEYRSSSNALSNKKIMKEMTREYELDKEELLKRYQETIVLSEKQVEALYEIFREFITLMWDEKMIRNEEVSLYAQITSYIDTNLKEPIRVDTLCKQFYISKNKLYKLVFEQSNMTVNEMILSRRLNLAKHLLVSTTYSIMQIASECGFANQNYFNRMFKRNFNISPLQYRKNMKTR